MTLETKLKLGLGLLINQTLLQAAEPAKNIQQRPNIIFIEVNPSLIILYPKGLTSSLMI